MQTIVPNYHEKAEWTRMARAAYVAGLPAVGQRYRGTASLQADQPIALATFDELQEGYRAWLVFNDFQKAADAARGE